MKDCSKNLYEKLLHVTVTKDLFSWLLAIRTRKEIPFSKMIASGFLNKREKKGD